MVKTEGTLESKAGKWSLMSPGSELVGVTSLTGAKAYGEKVKTCKEEYTGTIKNYKKRLEI